ncbi:MAG: TonB-dependent receptor [Litorimonas sp.]
MTDFNTPRSAAPAKPCAGSDQLPIRPRRYALRSTLLAASLVAAGGPLLPSPVQANPEIGADAETLPADPVATADAADGGRLLEQGVQDVFPADYFDLYVPRTALDMIRRIPGFQIQSGDTGRRGLGQGGANILINGERLTGKTDPFDQLSQILADSVVDITIRDGATLSIPGLSGQVADVRVERSRALKGTWNWNPQFRKRLEPNLTNAEVNLSGELGADAGKWGALTYAVTLRDYGFRSGALATETLRDATGTLFETRLEDIQNNGASPGVALNLGWTPRPDHKANLNLEYFLFDFGRDSRATRTPLTAAGDDASTLGRNSEDEWNFEMDADYELPFLSGKLKLTGVLDRESSPSKNSFATFRPASGFVSASRFEQVAEETELIGRLEYSWSPAQGRDWQIAAEGAYNELDIEQELFLQDPGEPFQGQGLSAFVVSEDRAEATVTHNRPLTDKLDLQASVGVEYSRLMQEDALGGAEPEAREFVRPKGFVSATYKVDETLNLRGRIEREVGQLNFFDFVASVDLEDDLGRTENFELVPSQSWLASFEVDKDFGQGNTVRVEVYGALISDTVDRIPIGTDGDAIGNIGTALRYGVDVVSTIKGDRWGLEGTELNLTFDWRDSTVDDPLLGFARRLNGDKEIYYEAEFRHDVTGTDWAYGGEISRFISAERFRLFSISRNGVDRPNTRLFIEHKDLAGLTVRASVFNLLDQQEFFERTRFDGRRDAGVLLQTERIDFDYGPILAFSVSGDF